MASFLSMMYAAMDGIEGVQPRVAYNRAVELDAVTNVANETQRSHSLASESQQRNEQYTSKCKNDLERSPPAKQ
jgi:hypothetical protein